MINKTIKNIKNNIKKNPTWYYLYNVKLLIKLQKIKLMDLLLILHKILNTQLLLYAQFFFFLHIFFYFLKKCALFILYKLKNRFKVNVQKYMNTEMYLLIKYIWKNYKNEI